MAIPAMLLLLLLPSPGRSIELSLEENRANRGNIGYVNIQRVFKMYPETIRAKETFETAVRQAEEQVNLRKAEMIRLRLELSQLKFERETILKTPPPAPSAPPAPSKALSLSPGAPLPAVSTVTTQAQVPISTFTVSASAGSAFGAPGESGSPLTSLPGISTTTALAPPGGSPGERSPAEEPSPPAKALSAALAELDDKIAGKNQEIKLKEAELKEQRAQAEKNLLDLESKKTEILLGKIHKAVKTVAKREGISVVVDKSAILFGHDAVDLTDRVLKELKGHDVK